ncbi:MAG: glucose-1-phosphate thymidylyltransferase, partial [Balneolaceae bacterium]
IIADEGPVYIGQDSKVEAGSIIKGPVAIGAQAEIKMGGKIFNGTTVGPVCKVGGEINNCIFHSYSNKAHDGFAGNSIIGQWSNFGAATNTSNLKNNYSKVRLPHWDSGEMSEDGVQFFGTVFGDFSKTAINTSLNTGTICGVSSNIFCSGFPPKIIPSFTWLGKDADMYEFDKAIKAIQAMMERRDVELSQEHISMMRYLFNLEYSSGS